MSVKHHIGTSKNGIPVYADLIQSQTAKQVSRQPHLLTLVEEALRNMTLKGADIIVDHDMKRPVGYSFVVPTTDADKVFYAKLLRDPVYTRFVKDGKPLTTTYLTLTLLHHPNDNAYELLSVEIGRARPPRPGSPKETAESKPFWANHAYVLDKQSLQSTTITKVCPY